MRTIEHVIEGEDLVSLKAALEDASGSEAVLWERRIDLDEGNAVELTIRGGGKDGGSWPDVVLVRHCGADLDEPRSLEISDGPLAQIVIPEMDVTLYVVEGETAGMRP